MNIEHDYLKLLQDILENGVEKKDRTGTGTVSVFGRQIRHNMKEGFPLLTTKKMSWKSIVTELVWFLGGNTNIKFLVDNDCNIWNGDAYKRYKEYASNLEEPDMSVHVEDIKESSIRIMTEKEFVEAIKNWPGFADKWGELGPIYGKQWRDLGGKHLTELGGKGDDGFYKYVTTHIPGIDQISNLIKDLRTNPDSRRLMVNAWNVAELDQMVLPPCHYGFQVWTRELNTNERLELQNNPLYFNKHGESINVPIRAISLMWNQRSVDTFLGLPFNIASYALLLEMIADEVNMIPDELIGNLGDVHLYSNHIEQAKEQLGRDLTVEERMDWWFKNQKPNRDVCDHIDEQSDHDKTAYFDQVGVPKRTREPMKLPTVHVRDGIYSFADIDVILENYVSHPTIKAPLSN